MTATPTVRMNWPQRLTVLTLLLSTAAAAAAVDLRGSDWGDSQRAVKARETHPMHHDLPGELAYWNFKLAGVRSGLTYTFEDDQLVEVRFYSRHTTPDIYLDWADFQAYRKHWTGVLGAPIKVTWDWNDRVSKHNRRETIEAIAVGSVEHTIRWQNDGTRVELRIAGSQGAITELGAYFTPEESGE